MENNKSQQITVVNRDQETVKVNYQKPVNTNVISVREILVRSLVLEFLGGAVCTSIALGFAAITSSPADKDRKYFEAARNGLVFGASIRARLTVTKLIDGLTST